MPKLYNTITKRWEWVNASYIGKFPFQETMPVEPAPLTVDDLIVKAPKKRKAEYVPNAIDADDDGRVQDGTIFERPVGTELSPEELTAISGTEE